MGNKIILITGVSSGFGRETAKYLASIGYNVYGSVRSKADSLPGVKLLNMDVTNPVSVKNGVDTIISNEGRIDILINNAGMGIAGAVEETDFNEIDIQFDTNFKGSVTVIRSVLPYMREKKTGTIINISSIGGLMGLPFQGFYSASKFAIEGLSQSLRMELKPYNINVVVVNPGDFNTGFTLNRRVAVGHNDLVYPQFNITLKAVEKDETSGLQPVVMAKKIASIVASPKPAYRYVVASKTQRLSVMLCRYLPERLFGNMLEKYYGIRN